MVTARRAYRSPIRAKQAQLTRNAILDAAERSFVDAGYAGTTMKDIAERVGVSVQSVHLFGTKASLLLAAVDRAISDGDGDGDEMSSTGVDGAFRAAVAARPKPEKLRRMRAFVRARMPQAAPLLRAFRDAASSDPAIAQAWRQHEGRRYADVSTFVESCGDLLQPGRSIQQAADIAWSAIVSPQVADMLMDGRGWTIDEYVDWAVETFDLLLLR
jgi:AcrR family transcriptional regulator